MEERGKESMGRLVGGDFLLNLAVIQLAIVSTLTNITDEEVISQLTNLKKYIPNPSMIKPIWVKLRDGDGKLVVARGSLSVVDADEFELDVILNGYTLKIHVKFTQVLNEDEQPIDDWYIATNDAKYLFTTNNFATFKVADVKNIDGEILSQLKCGDVVIKEDASGEHAYIVTYRGETGICLTYADASVIETQSYDLVDDEWVYNSEDKSGNLIEDVKPIYCHPLEIAKDGTLLLTALIFNNDDNAINNWDKLKSAIISFGNVSGYARLHCSGGIYDESQLKVATEIAYRFSTEAFIIVSVKNDGYISSVDITNMTGIIVVDSVNKIN